MHVELVVVVKVSASEGSSLSHGHTLDKLPCCVLCDIELVLGQCERCGRLSCLPEQLSPFQRLGLTPSPLVSDELVQQATRKALKIWHPVKVHKMYQSLSTQQRAYFLRDQKILSSTNGKMKAFYQYILVPFMQDEVNTILSAYELEIYTQLIEGVHALKKEFISLSSTLQELDDVDAHQERHRLVSRLSRFFHSHVKYLAQVMLQMASSDGSDLTSQTEVQNSESLDEHQDGSTVLKLKVTSQFLEPIKQNLELLQNIENHLLQFEQPTRPRWSTL